MKEIYLGDGAYAKFDGLDVLVIYTSNGLYPTNSVYIEGSAVRKLSEFIQEILK